MSTNICKRCGIKESDSFGELCWFNAISFPKHNFNPMHTTVIMEKEISFRQHGKNFRSYMYMIENVKNGKTVEIHAVDYVVLSRKRYEQLLSKAYPTDIQIIESD